MLSDGLGLRMGIDETNVICYELSGIPQIFTGDHTLMVLENSTYLWSNIPDQFSLKRELDIFDGNASTAMVHPV